MAYMKDLLTVSRILFYQYTTIVLETALIVIDLMSIQADNCNYFVPKEC